MLFSLRPLFRGLAVATSLLSSVTAVAGAQTIHPVAQQDRVPANASLTARAPLTGMLPRWANAAHQTATGFDLSQTLKLEVVLKRDDAVEASLEALIAAQQQPGSPEYHQWLTPAQFGARFGVTDNDLAAVENWLASAGLTVDQVQPNHVILDVSGTAANIANAFNTGFANFQVRAGETRYAATSDPQLPTALMPVIRGIVGLSQNMMHSDAARGAVALSASHKGGVSAQAVTPDHTASSTTEFLFADDFDTIYDSQTVLAAGNKGATIGSKAQRVAVVAISDIASTDVTEYESIMGLPSYVPTAVQTGADPGQVGGDSQVEAQLDFDRVYGTAPGVAVDMVTTTQTRFNDAVYTSAAYNVNTLLDPIMTISFGGCEPDYGAETNYNTTFQQAVSEGIAVFISTGDSGADGCLADGPIASGTVITGSPSVNALCGPYATCVGGTEFADIGLQSTYWNSTNNSAGGSAKGYIPEGAWNEPTCTVGSSCPTGYEIISGGGGASTYYTKPSWQTGVGVPTDGARDQPDVSLVSETHEGFFLCVDFDIAPYGCGGTGPYAGYGEIVGGTSAAAPSMAGIAALINTATGKQQGFLNPTLYKLFASTPSAFHDATPATSGVTTCSTSVASMCNNSDPSSTSTNAGVAGFALTTGYDEATGLGSVDIAKLIAAFGTNTTQATTLTVTASPNPVTTNSAVLLTATLAPYTASGSTATGSVQFYTVNGSTNTAIGTAQTLSTTGTAALSYTFTTAGTYSIIAVYTGDTNFSTSTSAAVTLTVNSAGFTITPSVTTYPTSGTLVSGTTVNDPLALASTNGFAGSVTLSCAVTNSSGTAAGNCSVAPSPVALAANGTAVSALSIVTTVGTSGVLTVKVTGISGSTTVSSTVTLTLTAPSFTITASPTSASIATGGSTTSTVTVTSVNGFAGSVALTCPVTATSLTGTNNGTCVMNPTTVTLTSGGMTTSVATITSTGSGTGVLNENVSGTGTTTGATVASTNACGTGTAPCIAVAVGAPFSLTPASGSLTFTSGATSGNTDVITVKSLSGFAGTVNLQCAISASTAAYQPSCVIAPTSVALTSGSSTTATVTIGSTTATTSAATGGVAAASTGGAWRLGALFAALLCLLALGRKRAWKSVALMALLMAGLGALSGCGGGNGPTSTPTPKSSAGSYTVTVTGGSTIGSASASQTTTFMVQIN